MEAREGERGRERERERVCTSRQQVFVGKTLGTIPEIEEERNKDINDTERDNECSCMGRQVLP